MEREYELFPDSSYYNMWCVKDKNNGNFDDTFHFIHLEDAEKFLELINKSK